MAIDSGNTKRLYYIDWLRVLVVLALIPFHASLTYLRYGVVYIKEPVSGLASLPFLIVEVPLGDFYKPFMKDFRGDFSSSFRSFSGIRTLIFMGTAICGFSFTCLSSP